MRTVPGSRTVVVESPLMALEPTGSTGCAGRRGPSAAARDSGRTPSLPWRRCKSFIMSNLPATPPRQVSCQLGRSSVGKTDRVPAPLPVAAGAATESSAPLVVPGTAPAFRRHADRRPKRAGRGGAGRFGTTARARGRSSARLVGPNIRNGGPRRLYEVLDKSDPDADLTLVGLLRATTDDRLKRPCFRSWCSETGVNPDAAEHAIGHDTVLFGLAPFRNPGIVHARQHVHVDADPIVVILTETLDKLRSSLEALESFDSEPEQIGTEQEQIGNSAR